MLHIDDHRRDYSGLRYVYPVVSRRAGGVSIGINLNPNNACNWACIYCQVPNLTRGGPPPLNEQLLARELDELLEDVINGDFMTREVPVGARQLQDIAFSGNGEPTSAPEFANAAEIVIDVLQRRQITPPPCLRLITNGSQLHRPAVQQGIARIGSVGGEIWFKIDRATQAGIQQVNQIAQPLERIRKNLERCTALAPTWIQTCWFRIDGAAPSPEERTAYLQLLAEYRKKIRGVHLYGLARPSLQPEANRLSPVSGDNLSALAGAITDLGIDVRTTP